MLGADPAAERTSREVRMPRGSTPSSASSRRAESAELAFIAGLASFLSPCVFPLVPAYVAFLSGRAGLGTLAAADVGAGADGDPFGWAPRRAPVLANGLAFVLGFTAVFVTYFYVFSAFDVTLLRAHQRIVNLVAGAIVVVLALEVMGVVRLGFLMRERRIHLLPGGSGTISALLLGVTFAAGWTPCIGPQLAAVLTVASQGDFSGMPLMLVYCMGLAVPFLALAALTDRLQGVIRAVNRNLGVINIAAGALLLIFGLFLLSNQFTVFNRLAPQSPFDL
jgi:cytochrome c-type biogenesis protein